jgi:hypothetical protein
MVNLPGHKCPKCGQYWGSRSCFKTPALCSGSDLPCPPDGGALPMHWQYDPLDPLDRFVIEEREKARVKE